MAAAPPTAPAPDPFGDVTGLVAILRDPARLAALAATDVTSVAPPASLDRLTRLGARLLRVPTCLVSLVGADPATPYARAFCQYVVGTAGPLVVRDAREHPLRRLNEAVGELGAIAYAGVPLVSAGGHALGSFCAIDDAPRDWSADDLATLADLAHAATAELDLRATSRSLAAASESLADLLDTTTELVCASDAEGRITFANRAWRDALGYDDLAPLRAIDLVAVEDRGRYVDVARRLIAGEPVEAFEAVLIARDGRRVACRGRATAEMVDDPAAPNGRRCAGTRAVYRDVTAERLADAARARLVATFEATSDFVGTLRPDGRIDYLNRVGRRLLGISDDADLAQYRAADAHPPETLALLREVGFPTALRDGTWLGEGELSGTDGGRIPVSISMVAHPSLVPGEPPYFSAVMRDLRERIRAEGALRDAARRFRLAMDASLDAFLALRSVRDADGTIRDFEIVEANRQAGALWRMPTEDLLGHHVCELFPAARGAEQLERWVRIVATGTPEEWEMSSTDPRTTARWLQVQAVRLEDGVALSMRDITARKRVERELNLLVDVTHALDGVDGLVDAARTVLESMCAAAGWEYGEAWLADVDVAGVPVLVHGPVWHAADDERLAIFAEHSDAYTFHRGEGTPGRVWTDRAPLWIRDLQEPDAGFRRSREAEAARLRSGVGVPLFADGELVAVLSFYTRDPSAVDESRLELLSAVAAQAGAALRRKVAEDTLAGERAFLAVVLDSLSEHVSVCDADGRLTLFNRATVESMGATADRTLPPERWSEQFRIFQPDGVTPFATAALPHVRAQREQRDVHGIEFVIAPDGRPRRTMVGDVHLLRGPDGECIGSVCAARDVTAQKAAEAALRESEGRLSLIYDNAADLIFLIAVARDADGAMAGLRVESVNATFLALTGLSVTDVIGRPVSEGLPSAFTEVAHAHFAHAVVTGDIVRFEHELALVAGAIMVDTTLTPVVDDDGRCTHVLGMSRDVTARHRAEAERTRLSAIIEATIDYVSIAEPDGRRVYLNAAGRALLEGPDAPEAIGRNVVDMYAGAARERFVREAQPAALRDGVWTGETAIVTADGRELPVSQVLLAHRDARGRLAFFATILRDLTAQKATEAALRDSEARYRALVDTSPDAVIVHRGGRIRYANEAARTLLGARDAGLIGTRVLDLVHPEDRARVVERIRRVVADRLTADVAEERLVRVDDGHVVHAESAAAPVRFADADGVHDAVQVVFRDVTARQAAEAALRESESRFRGMLETVRSIAITLDVHGRVTFVNDALVAITGWSREEIVGSDWFARFVPAGHEIAMVFHGVVAHGDIPSHYENEILTRSGARRLIAWDNTVLRDGDGAVVGTASLGHDITERRALEARLAALSEHDELTGLLNRRGFRRMAEQALKVERRLGRRSALLYIDLDGFKPINDTYGHATGDAALRFVADLLRSTVRDADLVARLGGDEFALLATDLSDAAEADAGEVLATRVRETLAARNAAAASAGRPYEIRFSIGVATHRPGDDLDALLARADTALYALKKRGREAAVVHL